MFLSVLSDLNKICLLKHIKHVETNKPVRYTVLGLLLRLSACRCSFLTTKLGPFCGPEQHWMTCVIQAQHSQNFRSYCLLTPLMSPKDRKCKLVDWLIDCITVLRRKTMQPCLCSIRSTGAGASGVGANFFSSIFWGWCWSRLSRRNVTVLLELVSHMHAHMLRLLAHCWCKTAASTPRNWVLALVQRATAHRKLLTHETVSITACNGTLCCLDHSCYHWIWMSFAALCIMKRLRWELSGSWPAREAN